MGRVLVVGSSNTDLVARTPHLPLPGETVAGTNFATYAGGKGANQAVAAARAGAAVTFVGAVGDDDFGAARRDDLEREGIDTHFLRTIPAIASGVAMILVDDRAENVIVMVPGANNAVDAASSLQVAAQAPHDVLSLVLEIPWTTVEALVTERRSNRRVVLNAAPFDRRVIGLLPHIDVLICNETEASQMLGTAITSENACDAAMQLLRTGCGAAVITLGADGVAAAWEDGAFTLPSVRVQAVDTTGAGDAFCGACAAWLADGEVFPNAVRAGIAAGACAVTIAGAQPSLPARDAILAMMHSVPSLP